MSSEMEALASFFDIICRRDGVGRGMFVEFVNSSQIGVPDDFIESFNTILMRLHQNRSASSLLKSIFRMETKKNSRSGKSDSSSSTTYEIGLSEASISW